MAFDGVRLNQLSLARQLSGDLTLTPPRCLIRAKGNRSDEVLELDIALPAAEGVTRAGQPPEVKLVSHSFCYSSRAQLVRYA